MTSKRLADLQLKWGPRGALVKTLAAWKTQDEFPRLLATVSEQHKDLEAKIRELEGEISNAGMKMMGMAASRQSKDKGRQAGGPAEPAVNVFDSLVEKAAFEAVQAEIQNQLAALDARIRAEEARASNSIKALQKRVQEECALVNHVEEKFAETRDDVKVARRLVEMATD